MTSAQEYKYFYIRNSDKYTVVFSPKNLKPDLMERKNNPNILEEPKLNDYYFNTFMPIYKDVFGADFKYENWRILGRINCSFWFGEDFKPSYYQITFPTELLDEFPQWEEKLYQLCERSMKVDIRSFINPQKDKSNFGWSNFHIIFSNLYLYSEGRLRIDDY